MTHDEIQALKAKRICIDCVGEQYLSTEIRSKGKRRRCSYCRTARRSYDLDELAECVATAFDRHYRRTSDQPDDLEFMLMRDKESSYEWYRHGDPVVVAITEAAEIPEEAAEDIQKILAYENADFESQQMGEETEFDDDTYYQARRLSDESWQEEWRNFETSLRSEARFFSRSAAKHLASIFEGIDQLKARDGRPLILDAGPGTAFHTLYRARVFQSDSKLEAALCRPDTLLGSPPSPLAMAGRMNARGISVFYGAGDAMTAIAEVRPPVGSQVAVAQFEILRKLRLLDLTALNDVHIAGSIFDPGHAARLERAQFLRSLSSRITRPVMPDDEPFAYLATQAIADYLATQESPSVDGIIFPSVQVAGNVLNVVLFHKAARVEEMEIPDGTEISARTGHFGEEGWENDYYVTERVSPPQKEEKRITDDNDWPDLSSFLADPSSAIQSPSRESTLRIITDSVTVHQIQRVEFRTQAFSVRRHRWKKHNPDF